MQRLRLAEKEFDPNEFQSGVETLVEKVQSNIPVDGDFLRSLYEMMPDEVKYSGYLYRGFSIETSHIVDLFENKAFNSGYDNQVESWTPVAEVANEFAEINIKKHKPIAVIARIIVEPNDPRIVMDMTPNAFSWLAERVLDEVRMETGEEEIDYELLWDGMVEGEWAEYAQVLDQNSREEEVMIQGESRYTYTLCENVIGFMVNGWYIKEAGQDLFDLVFKDVPENQRQEIEGTNTIVRASCHNGQLNWFLY